MPPSSDFYDIKLNQEAGTEIVNVRGEDGTFSLAFVIQKANQLGAEGKLVVDADFADKDRGKIRLFWHKDYKLGLWGRLAQMKMQLEAAEATSDFSKQTVEQLRSALEAQSESMNEANRRIESLERQLSNGRLELYEIPMETQ